MFQYKFLNYSSSVKSNSWYFDPMSSLLGEELPIFHPSQGSGGLGAQNFWCKPLVLADPCSMCPEWVQEWYLSHVRIRDPCALRSGVRASQSGSHCTCSLLLKSCHPGLSSSPEKLPSLPLLHITSYIFFSVVLQLWAPSRQGPHPGPPHTPVPSTQEAVIDQ